MASQLNKEGINIGIGWCHYTVNLWWGCFPVHAGCDNCYASALSHRWGNDLWGNDKPRKLIESVWRDLARYQRLAKAAGEMHRVFVNSMSDLFEKPMPLIKSKREPAIDASNGSLIGTDHLRNLLFDAIDEGMYPNLIFLLLTKRPSNINKYIPESWRYTPPPNVMFGTSPVNPDTFNKLFGQLCEVNGKRFLSIEPQLDLIDFNYCKFSKNYITDHIDWIIQGGESGHGRRPFNINWACSMRDQCAAAGVTYFFKQIDGVKPIPEDLNIHQFPSYHQFIA